MCLMRKLPKEHFRSALQRLLNGDFQLVFFAPKIFWLSERRLFALDGCGGRGYELPLPVIAHWNLLWNCMMSS